MKGDSLEVSEQEGHQLGRLQSALRMLDSRSRNIVDQRWLREDGKAGLQELADQYGVSAERIRQIEAAALKKLRGALAT